MTTLEEFKEIEAKATKGPWVEIDFLPGYFVDAKGNVACGRPRNRHAKPPTAPRPIKPSIDKRKKTHYAKVCIRDGDVKRTYSVHKLVALAFLGPIPDGLQINHINGNGLDNVPNNLEYVTARQNIDHRDKNKTNIRGTYKRPNGKYAAEISLEGKRIKLGTHDTQEQAGEAYQQALAAYEAWKLNIEGEK